MWIYAYRVPVEKLYKQLQLLLKSTNGIGSKLLGNTVWVTMKSFYIYIYINIGNQYVNIRL